MTTLIIQSQPKQIHSFHFRTFCLSCFSQRKLLVIPGLSALYFVLCIWQKNIQSTYQSTLSFDKTFLKYDESLSKFSLFLTLLYLAGKIVGIESFDCKWRSNKNLNLIYCINNPIDVVSALMFNKKIFIKKKCFPKQKNYKKCSTSPPSHTWSDLHLELIQ